MAQTPPTTPKTPIIEIVDDEKPTLPAALPGTLEEEMEKRRIRDGKRKRKDKVTYSCPNAPKKPKAKRRIMATSDTSDSIHICSNCFDNFIDSLSHKKVKIDDQEWTLHCSEPCVPIDFIDLTN